MAKKWRIVSEYLGEPADFDSLQELLDALETLGVNTDVLREGMEKGGRRVLRTRAYTEPGVSLFVEAFHEDFDHEVWLRSPNWHVIAEEVRGEEE